MPKTHYINPDLLHLEDIEQITCNNYALGLSEESLERIKRCRQYLEHKLKKSEKPFYGINTGFGSLCNIRISEKEIEQLQLKLILSHAAGIGAEVPEHIVKIMLLLKIQSLSYGHSGIRVEIVQKLTDFYNQGVSPVIYQLGSLGASGDLAPLAHLSLPLIGKGHVNYKGQRQSASEVLHQLGWDPVQLKSKEGLALLNGTQFSTAYGTYCLIRAKWLLQLADLCAAISLDAFDCSLLPFDKRLHLIRPHKGQQQTSARILDMLKDSQIAQKEKTHVQDPYAFRCVPQVHGASVDAIAHIEQVVVREINSVTDNPNIFPEDDTIISGGNFHAQPIALSLDYLAIALAELGNISERRTFQLLTGKRGLPAFLSPNAGLNSGLMIAQYTAASIVSQNKQYCTPASVDSIVSSNGQEDHVSMAANAATKAFKVVENLERILAIEFMVATQALEFRRPQQSSQYIEDIVSRYRQLVPPLKEDRILSTDILRTLDFFNDLRAHPPD